MFNFYFFRADSIVKQIKDSKIVQYFKYVKDNNLLPVSKQVRVLLDFKLNRSLTNPVVNELGASKATKGSVD